MEVKLVVGKNGVQRAFRWSSFQSRWFPMPLKDARKALEAGEASLVEEGASKTLFSKMSPATVRVAKDPVYVDEKGAVVDLFAFFPEGGNA